METNILTLIPARGGSKRIKNKNIKLLSGKPCIQYTIESAQKAGLKDIVVSTDCEEIAKTSKVLGATVPFLRPKKISGDNVPDYPVVEHALKFFFKKKFYPEIIIYLRPTMPLREHYEIKNCLKIIMSKKDIDAVRSTSEVPYTPFWMKKIDKNGLIKPFINKIEKYQFTRSQDLPKVVICDGYVDIIKVKTIQKYKKLYAGKIFAYHREIKFCDIDTEEDWEYAEYLISKKV